MVLLTGAVNHGYCSSLSHGFLAAAHLHCELACTNSFKLANTEGGEMHDGKHHHGRDAVGVVCL